MRKLRSYLAVFLVFCMTVCSASIFAVVAQTTDDSEIFIENLESQNAKNELQPMVTSNCPTYIPGIGYTGSQAWYSAIAVVQAGGHIQGWGSSGVYLAEAHARMLISAAGYQVYGGVEQDDDCHNYPHIHYWRNGSRHNSIRLG